MTILTHWQSNLLLEEGGGEEGLLIRRRPWSSLTVGPNQDAKKESFRASPRWLPLERGDGTSETGDYRATPLPNTKCPSYRYFTLTENVRKYVMPRRLSVSATKRARNARFHPACRIITTAAVRQQRTCRKTFLTTIILSTWI